MSRAISVIMACLAILFVPRAPGFADAQVMPEHKGLWRFEFDNDTFAGEDNAFTAGLSLQYHSPLYDSWGEGRGSVFAGIERWVGRVVPGLGDDGEGGRRVRLAIGLSQQIYTPEDLSNSGLQPDDMPWAGVLGINGVMSSFNNQRLGAIQLYLGCMGPCSGAEHIQRFVHETLGVGETLSGWENQLETTPLFNLNYTYKYKLRTCTDEAYSPGRFAADLAVGGQAAVGNYFSFADAQVEFRFGWGMPMGFTHIPDPPARGISLDPVFDPGCRSSRHGPWRGYFSAVVRASAILRIAPAEGGATANGDRHPGVDYEDKPVEVIVGAHLARLPIVIHFTYYHYIDSGFMLGLGSESSLDWANISFEYRF